MPRRTTRPAALPILSPKRKRDSEQLLLKVSSLPTAAGREQRVMDDIQRWVAARDGLRIEADRAGNLVITQTVRRRSGHFAPLFITAHLDHPAFVVREVLDDRTIALEFRGGVHDPYFESADIEVFDEAGKPHRAQIRSLDAAARPFKRVIAHLAKSARSIRPDDIGRWRFPRERKPVPRIERGLLHTHACDDLAAAAAALAAFDVIRNINGCGHVGLLFTRAEEVGFIGAIAACKLRTVPKNARLICLENSRSFAHDSPVGGGPIVRVGDKMSVFEPTLTNHISLLMTEHEKANPRFQFQRKLMPGGTCEATTFSTYGYQSTCLCLPLGNYHNMVDIDGVLAGKRKARVGPEFISIDDYHALIEMLIVCATQLDAADAPSLKNRMEGLYAEFGFVLGETSRG